MEIKSETQLRWSRILRVGAFLGIYLLGVLTPYSVYYALTHAWPVGREELRREVSPDGAVDAVLMEANPGAMSSYIYQVHIVPHGEKVTEGSDSAILSGRHLEGQRMVWKRPALLEVQYDSFHISYFRNLWHSQLNRGSSHLVEIRLAPTSDGYVTKELRELNWID